MKTLAEIKQWTQGSWQQPGLVVPDDFVVNEVTHQTDQLEKGWAFVALPGVRHGGEFWPQAKQKGAACILSDKPVVDCDLPVLIVDNLSARLADFADWFYDSPSRQVNVIGVTGTNGKTSTTHYIAQLLLSQQQRVGVIGTLGNGEFGQLSFSQNTTPEILTVQRWLRHFYRQGIRWVVMEVSSHALALGRVKGVIFACVALTQVTRDHLDFHLDVAEYRQTKKRLFTEYATKTRVVNMDDAMGRQLANEYPVFSYSHHPQTDSTADLVCQDLVLDATGIKANLVYKQQEFSCDVTLMGRFNAENVLCALSCLLSLDFAMPALQQGVKKLEAVTGRMQVIPVQDKSVIAIVDYAHTADALEQVLLALKAHLQAGRLWLVFGCGGDRDKGKRPLMGEVAQRLADEVVLTSDNPRSENPLSIMQQIVQGMRGDVVQIESRKTAIEWALNQAQAGDIVLIAGKGHESYQEIQGQKYPFSDQQVIAQWKPAK